jgi:hypothetical protein
VRSVVGYSPDGKDVSIQAENSPLLRSVAGKWQAKADYEDLACGLVICKVWKLATAL